MLALKSRVYILLFILILTFGCSEKRTIVQDNVTANLNINSVAQSENTDILEGNEKFSAGDFDEAIKLYEKASKENKATAFYNPSTHSETTRILFHKPKECFFLHYRSVPQLLLFSFPSSIVLVY